MLANVSNNDGTSQQLIMQASLQDSNGVTSVRVNSNHTIGSFVETKNEKGAILQTCTDLRIGTKDVLPQTVMSLKKRLMQMMHLQTALGHKSGTMICEHHYLLE